MTDSSDSAEWKGVLLGMVGVLALVVVCVVLLEMWGLRWADGLFQGAFVQEDALFVGEFYDLPSGGEGSSGGYRVTKLALDSGEIVGRLSFDGEPRCAPAGSARAFCFDGTAHLVDTEALADVSGDWYGDDAPLGEEYDDIPAPYLVDGALLTRARDGRWMRIDAGGAVAPASAPEGSDSMRWPLLADDSVGFGRDDLIDARRLIVDGTPTWLADHAASMDSDDGRLLSVERDGQFVRVELEDPFDSVSAVTARENDLVVVVRADDATDVLRITPAGEVRWRTTL